MGVHLTVICTRANGISRLANDCANCMTGAGGVLKTRLGMAPFSDGGFAL